MRTYTMLLAALVAAVACGLGAGPRVAGGQSPGSLADINVGLAAVWYPPDEHLEAFAVDDSGTVRGVWKEHNSVWRPPFSLTPPNFAPPGAPLAAVYYPNGEQLEVFVVGNDGTLWVIWKANNGPWQAPGRLTGPNFAPAGAAISAVYYPNGEQLEVFVVDRNGAVSVVWKAKGKDWQPPAGITRPNFAREGAPLSAVYYPNDEHLEVFVAGNGAVQVVWKAQGGGWQPPVTLTGPDFASTRAPVAAVYQPRNEQLEVLYVGKDGSLWDSWKARGTNWQPPARIAGPNFVRDGTPLAAVYQPVNEQLEVLAVDGAGAVRDVHKAHN